MPEIKIPRILISASRGGSGKTTFVLGLMRALQNRDLRVAPFKKGPDYIDPGWLGLSAKAVCYNLDQFMMSSDTILKSLYFHSKGSDIAVIEGNRGLYDGLDEEGSCSSASLAKLIGSPVVMVIDCTKATRTVAALVKGLLEFDPSLALRAVVLNNVAGSRHERLLRTTIERYTDAEVIGVMGKMDHVPILMRHLGLTPAHEHPGVDEAIQSISEMVSRGVDIERVVSLARTAPVIDVPEGALYQVAPSLKDRAKGLTVVVFRDPAFQFYYPENIEILKTAGMVVKELDTTKEGLLPECDLVYLGGGFPETNAPLLSRNELLLKSVQEAAEKGVAFYAECGGLMFLGTEIYFKETRYRMSGILPIRFSMQPRPVAHGYTIVETTKDSAFFRAGVQLRGHEFHYSRPEILETGKLDFVFKMKKGRGILNGLDGVVSGRIFGTYTHLHTLGSPQWLEAIINAAGG